MSDDAMPDIIRAAPICVGFQVYDKMETVVSDGFNTDSFECAARALERAARQVREYGWAKCNDPRAFARKESGT